MLLHIALIVALGQVPVPPPIFTPAPVCVDVADLSGKQRFAVCKASPLTLDCDDPTMEMCFVALRCEELTLCEYLACVDAMDTMLVCTSQLPAACVQVQECINTL